MVFANVTCSPHVFDHQAGLQAVFMFMEEAVVLVMVIISVPVLTYAMEKLLKRKLYHPLPILLIYMIFFFIYFDIMQGLMQKYL